LFVLFSAHTSYKNQQSHVERKKMLIYYLRYHIEAGLSYLNFQMGFKRVRMGYLRGTTALLMGYIIGVHVIIFKIEEYARKVGEKNFF